MSDNPIPLGLPWSQAFDFPEGFFLPGDSVRFEFRRFAGDAQPMVTLTDGAGTQIVGERLHVSMTGEQTARMQKTGEVRTMPLLIRGGEPVFLDILIEIPVVQPYTRGQP